MRSSNSKRANDTPQPVAKSSSFAPSAVPFTNYPDKENCRKKNQQINRDQRGQSDPNHGDGLGEGLEVGTKSLPQRMVAVVQKSALPLVTGEFSFVLSRQS